MPTAIVLLSFVAEFTKVTSMEELSAPFVYRFAAAGDEDDAPFQSFDIEVI